MRAAAAVVAVAVVWIGGGDVISRNSTSMTSSSELIGEVEGENKGGECGGE